jgi:hypothetical protein
VTIIEPPKGPVDPVTGLATGSDADAAGRRGGSPASAEEEDDGTETAPPLDTTIESTPPRPAKTAPVNPFAKRSPSKANPGGGILGVIGKVQSRSDAVSPAAKKGSARCVGENRTGFFFLSFSLISILLTFKSASGKKNPGTTARSPTAPASSARSRPSPRSSACVPTRATASPPRLPRSLNDRTDFFKHNTRGPWDRMQTNKIFLPSPFDSP